MANYLKLHLTESALEDLLFNVNLALNSNLKELIGQHNLLQKYRSIHEELIDEDFCLSIKKFPAVLIL